MTLLKTTPRLTKDCEDDWGRGRDQYGLNKVDWVCWKELQRIYGIDTENTRAIWLEVHDAPVAQAVKFEVDGYNNTCGIDVWLLLREPLSKTGWRQGESRVLYPGLEKFLAPYIGKTIYIRCLYEGES